MSKLSLGWIPYWNLHPLKKELLDRYSDQVRLHGGEPVVVNQMLKDGVVDIAPCSSICLLKNREHQMSLPLGVAAVGATHSVYWGLKKEHVHLQKIISSRILKLKPIFAEALRRFAHQPKKSINWLSFEISKTSPVPLNLIPTVALDLASESSSMLTRIFYAVLFGTNSEKFLATKAPSGFNGYSSPVQLLIGDRALKARKEFFSTIDLGSLWFDLTGLPFVFAVWQSKQKPTEEWYHRIMLAGELAEKKMRIDPLFYVTHSEKNLCTYKSLDLSGYWKRIYYRLGKKELKSLSFFLCLARFFFQPETDSTFVYKLASWQDSWSSHIIAPEC